MAKRGFSAEQIVNKLREADLELFKGVRTSATTPVRIAGESDCHASMMDAKFGSRSWGVECNVGELLAE